MDFKGQPLVDNCKFLLKSFDNTFADIAEGSDIVGIDGYFYRAHPFLLCNCACLPFVIILKRLGITIAIIRKQFTWLLILFILWINQVPTYM